MSQELKIGLFVLAAAVALFLGIRFLQGLPLLGAGYEVVVLFEDTQGLAPGNAVRLSGVDVGTVSEVALARNERGVYATFAIQPGVEIPRASRITIGGFAALGDVFVNITPPETASAGRPLVDGDTLRAATSPDLVSLLTDRAGPIALRTDSLLVTALSTLRGIEGFMQESGGDLDATLANLRFLTTAATRVLLEERERIGGISATLERAALAAERSALAAEGLVGEYGDAFGGQAPVFRDSLALVATSLNARLRQLEASLEGLDRVTVSLDSTLALVNSPDGSMGLLLRDPSLYHNANAAAASLQQLLTDFHNDPARYLQELELVDLF